MSSLKIYKYNSPAGRPCIGRNCALAQSLYVVFPFPLGQFVSVTYPSGRAGNASNFRVDHVTRNALAARKNEAQGLGNKDTTPHGLLKLDIKETVSRLCARASVICFFFKRQQTCQIDSTRFPSGPHRRRRFVVYILRQYFKLSKKSFVSSPFYRQQGHLVTRKSLSARFKNRFSNMKLVSEVNCSKCSNICLICSRSSLKRWKDTNKNAISTL